MPTNESSATQGRSDKEIWPCGRYEVYGGTEPMDMERLNGFHTQEEAFECASAFVGVFSDVLTLDRADRFVWDGEGPTRVAPKLTVKPSPWVQGATP